MLYLAGANTMGQTGKRAIGRGVRITADHRHPGDHCALFRGHHMDDALANIANTEFGNAELLGVVLQGLHLDAGGFIHNFRCGFEWGGRHVVIDGGHAGTRTPGFATRQTQALEGLWRRHLMNDLTIDIDQRGAILTLGDEVSVPQFVIEGFAGHVSLPVSRCSNFTIATGLSITINVGFTHQ